MPFLTPKRKIALWILAGLFVVYSLAGFVAAPMILRHVLEKTIPQTIHRQVTVEAVRVNPYALNVVLYGLSVADETATTLISLDEVKVNAEISSLFRRALVIKSVLLTMPKINLVRTTPQRFNFSDLLERRGDTDQATPAEPGKPLRVVLGKLQIVNGRLRFDDRSLKKPFSSTLSAINISVTAIDTAPKAPAGEFNIAFKTETDEIVDIKGRLAPSPLDVAAEITNQAIDLVKYQPYYQPFWKGQLKAGKLDLSLSAHWSTEAGRIESIMLKLADLQVANADAGTPLLHIPLFEILNARVDLPTHTADLGTVRSRDATAWIRREADGGINAVTAMSVSPSPTSTAPQTPIRESAPVFPGRMSSPVWTVVLPALEIQNYRVEVEDRLPAQPAHVALSQINIGIQGLSTRPEETGDLSMDLNWAEQGALKMTGQIGLIPVKADLNLSADSLDIRPIQPYLNEVVGLLLTSGRFNTQGNLTLAMAPEASPDIHYTGQASLVDFESVDTAQHADFFNFKSLYLNGIDARVQPLELTIEEVSLTDFYNKLLIAADGTSNIDAILQRSEVDTEAPNEDPAQADAEPHDSTSQEQTSEPAPIIQIKTVTLQGGAIDFSDLNVKPSVRLPMTKVGGRISGLDAIRENKADVLLEGMVRGNVPMKISGKINPLIKPPFVDIQLNLTSVDLSPFTPYAEKYLGYELTKGQLSMNLAYFIEDNQLQGQNNAVLNQLTLGQSVPGPSATKLPVKLAIALLKDRNGNIDIDLPVKGDLDDPEFSIGGIVFKMLGNLILEIVTSPFKILGALFGGGEELSNIDFEAGVAELSPENRTKIDGLAKILFERPGLNLEIQGRFSTEEDSEGLRIARFDRQLRNAKLKAMLADGQRAVPLEKIVIPDQERDQMVRQTYASADFPKPRDDKGREKVLPLEEMEKMLYTAIEITEDDLRHLAHQRALAAETYLAATGRVEPERLFILEADAGNRQVMFSLK